MIKEHITIENARIGFRNFSGQGGQYNPVGNRNFCVFFGERASSYLREGWLECSLASASR